MYKLGGTRLEPISQNLESRLEQMTKIRGRQQLVTSDENQRFSRAVFSNLLLGCPGGHEAQRPQADDEHL